MEDMAIPRPSWSVRLGQFLLLSLAVTLLPALSHASERLVIPFEQDQYDRLVVEITLNDSVSATSVVDTAATMPLIGGPTARAAGITIQEGEERYVTILGLGGPEVFPLIGVSRLKAGNMLFEQVPAALDANISVRGVSNVLPINALEGDVIDFDFDTNSLLAYDRRPIGPPRDVLSRMPLTTYEGLYFVDVSINGKKGRALIDTGSTVTYVNSAFADLAELPTNERKTEELHGITGGRHDMRMARVAYLRLGDLKIKKLDFLVSDPDLFDHLGISEEPIMILGVDFLSKFRMQIDRKKNRLYLRARRNVNQNCDVCLEFKSFVAR